MIILRSAVLEDSESIFNLLNPYADQNIILRRPLKEIQASIEKFFVAADNDTVVGAVSFYDYGHHLKEIRSLAVHDGHKKKKVGSALVKNLIEELLKAGNVKIFALTYTPEFFIKNGFVEVEKDTLPEKIWKDCVNCANLNNCTETAVVYINTSAANKTTG